MQGLFTNPDRERRALDLIHSSRVTPGRDQAPFEPLTRLAAQLCQAAIATIEFPSSVDGRLAAVTAAPVDARGAIAPMAARPIKASDTASYSLPEEALNQPWFVVEVPLVSPEGDLLGQLCLFNPHPYALTVEQAQALELVAAQIVLQLRLQHQVASLEANLDQRQQQISHLQEAHQQLQTAMSLLERRNRQGQLLSRLSQVLHDFLSLQEARETLARFIAPLFPEESGAIAIVNLDGSLNWIAQWGDPPIFTESGAIADYWHWLQTRTRAQESVRETLVCEGDHAHQPPVQYGCFPLLHRSELVGLLCVTFSTWDKASIRNQKRLAFTTSGYLATGLANLQQREQLHQQSIQDPLTGLFNRRYMTEALHQTLQRACQSNTPVALVMLDIDHFKRFNDSFGHPAGDMVLRDFSLFVKGAVRGSDLACRYGGEEFTLILPGVTLEVARQRADKLRRGIKYLNMQYQGQSLGVVTLSAGVAVFPLHGMTAEALIYAADQALYQAKANGRDRVEVAIASPEQWSPVT